MMAKKPDGLGPFQSLLRGLAEVPKKELDRAVEKRAKKAAKRKK